MNNPEDGGIPPNDGASAGVSASSGPAPPQTGAQNRAANHGSGEAPAPEDAPARRKKRRRKRRRGRKVYARDAAFPPASKEDRAPPSPENPAPDQPDTTTPKPVSVHGHRRPRRPFDVPVYAALDLGTNNCRLLVAIPTRPGQFRVIDAFSRIVRLGEGLAVTGRLNDDAMERAIGALHICRDKLGARRIRRTRLIATEACRSAQNGAAFLRRVHVETGLELEVVDRQTEARLAVSGCGSLVERGTQGVVLFDIGGGSSEIALIDLTRRRAPGLAEHIVAWTSLPVGVVSLAERFGGRHVTPEIFKAMTNDVSELLEAFEERDRLQHIMDGSRFHLLGTSGTVTTLAGIHLGLERYDRRRVDGIWMKDEDVTGTTERLLGWAFDERVANPCIGADRADLVLAGCAILEAIRRKWPSERLRVADRGLREGILTELMARDGVWRRRRKRNRYPQ